MNNDLVTWSAKEFKSLPWRQNRSLYRTLVSEIMLQQTTVATVLNHFDCFIKKYPNIDSLANSTEEELTIAWKGLGYYRRARNLHKACQYFQKNFSSKIPLNFDDLVKAPGIGEYTANAILAIGANKDVLCIDANLERVLSRLYHITEDKGPKLIRRINELFKDKEIAQEISLFGGQKYNEALMDLGRVFCQANKVSCLICPLSNNCRAYKKGNPLDYPVKNEKNKKQFFELNLLRFVVLKDNQVLCYEKEKDEWLSGQKEIPTFVLNIQEDSFFQYPFLESSIEYELLPIIKTSITKYKINNYLLVCDEEEFLKITKKKVQDGFSYVENDEKINLSTASVKCLKFLLSNT